MDSKLRTETLSPKQIRMRGTLTPPRINLGDALRICLVFRTSAEPGARTGRAAERQHPHPQTGTFSDLARGNSLPWRAVKRWSPADGGDDDPRDSLRRYRSADVPCPSSTLSRTSTPLATCPGKRDGLRTRNGRARAETRPFRSGASGGERRPVRLSGASDGECVEVVGQDRPSSPGSGAVVAFSLDLRSPYRRLR